MYVGTKQMKIPHFIMLKGVCHKVVIVKGGRANDDQNMTKGDRGRGVGGVSRNPQNWLT